jgi:hypothetical protein
MYVGQATATGRVKREKGAADVVAGPSTKLKERAAAKTLVEQRAAVTIFIQ